MTILGYVLIGFIEGANRGVDHLEIVFCPSEDILINFKSDAFGSFKFLFELIE